MTKEEILEILRQKGISVGAWTEQDPKTVKSPILEKQRKNLETLKTLIEQQIEKDVEAVADLHIALQKVKGGKNAK